MSVDLEDWYHICGIENQQWADEWHKYSARLEKNVNTILRLFEKYNIRATFFVVGYIAEKNPELVRKIADSGHELATHGYLHHRIFDMTPQEFEEDLLKSKKAIEAVSGKKVLGYRAPEWSLKKENEWALDILKKNGFEYDASANPLSHCSGKYFGVYPGQIETKYGKINEFPVSTYRWFTERLPFSGGLPFRLNPYFHICDTTRLINRDGFPVIFVIHPWEFDKERVKIDLPLNRKFMHYFNCSHVPPKIELVLGQFEFTTVEEVLKLRKSAGARLKRVNKKWRFDKEYAISVVPIMIIYVACVATFTLIAPQVKYYALLPVVIILATWYLPWGILIKFIDFLRKR